MQKPYRISIITPSLNQAEFIERTIESVLGQGYPELEYIVVDGGSTDGTVEILKRYEDRLRWVSEPDKGQSDAINKGIHMSTGAIVAYLNSDDTYAPETLARVADYFAQNQRAMWLTGRCRIVDDSDREVRGAITRYKNFFLSRYSYNTLLVLNFISQPATFLRRKVIDEFGYFDVAHHRVMDYEYWLRIGAKYEPAVLDDYLASFRVYGKTKTSSGFSETFAEEYEVSKNYSHSILLNMLHYLSCAGIRAVYFVLGMLGRK